MKPRPPGAGALGQWWKNRSAALKLALAYGLIITLLSLLFSVIVYQFAETQVVDGLRRQYMELGRQNGFSGGQGPGFLPGEGRRLRPDSPEISAAIQPLVEAARRELIGRLVYVNLVIILLGGAVSYLLAKRTMRPIERALEAQTRFTADASHELRTPLAVMRTEIEIARSDSALTKTQAFELLDSNLEEVKKLHALADALLRLARSNAGGLSLGPTSATKVAGESIDRVASRAKAAGIQVVNDTSDVTVLADQATLTELLSILLDNAIKYSDSGTTIQVRARRDGGAAVLSVADQGRGINSADLPHVFERFYRADKSRTHSDVEGYGLGLSIAKQIADLHHASLSVNSRPGEGSTFSLRLPVA